MEFRFRAGDGGPSRPFSRLSRPDDRRFTPRAGLGPLHGGPLPPPLPPPAQIEWEAAARRERIIREEVERRLIEEEVCRELAIARARLHGGFRPEPFYGPFMPPPPGPFLGPDAHFVPPPMPAGNHPNGAPPASFGPATWQGSRPPRDSGFGQRKLIGEARRRRPKTKHKLEPLNVEPSETSEILSSVTKVSSVKNKVDAIVVSTEPMASSEANISGVKRKADVIAAATEKTKSEKAAPDWSCALCQVHATSEANLNTHLNGKKHKAKMAQCGIIKMIGDYGNGFQATTENKDSGCPTDASRKICILVDGVMHEVVQKCNHLWCERCRVRCENNMTMADHLRGKKHSQLNKVWKSITAVRLSKNMEGSAATCKSKVNENGPLRIPEEVKKEGAFMTNELNENGADGIHVEMKNKTTDVDEEVNENSLTESPVEIKKEKSDIASEVNRNGHIKIPTETECKDADMASKVNEENAHVRFIMDFKHEGTDVVMDVNRSGFTEIPGNDMKEGADMAME
ncbi:hypothetical protein PR202_ga14788 [Eleusine coracana subsp. coracana]|uniref:U1-type domain-containing protein n=1 Tax=Eleusine coracana subsp. coracana TaxID=191504 RepID=A0AAV5CIK8_ELECO|nr:hypothetical protein QOZ80_6BG0500110 [Eleusine coracana subsp. coracana]GJM97832.1 hypothetical protein PR202_ga14788 [Eleusine coracana subsp. coracana]